MTIISLVFFIFVAVTVLAYFMIPQKFRWIVLLIASYVFYWLNSKWLVFVLLSMTLITWLIGLWIQRVKDTNAVFLETLGKELPRKERKESKETTKRKTRRILFLGIALDLLMLLFLKYYNFFGNNINLLLNKLGTEGTVIPQLNLLLPLGISFYTLQAISYMTDIYRGKTQPDRNPAKFMLFMSFFPQIVQGPIPRHARLANQLYEGHAFSYENLCFGAQLMLWGVLKKIVIAERLAIPVATIMGNYAESYGPINFFGVALYGLQVYADFSGGMDIARGAAQMVGIKIEMNFAQPYFSNSLEDFWRRWHITMGQWMRDYVFFPLSLSKAFTTLSRKSRKLLGTFIGKRLPSFLAMFIVYLLVGFWHGAQWKYVMFGIWNGVIIMCSILLENVYRSCREKCRIQEDSISWRVFRMLRTFIIVSFGRFFTAAYGLMPALKMFKHTFSLHNCAFLTNGALMELGLMTSDWIVLGIAAILLFLVDAAHEKKVAIREVISNQALVFRWVIYIAAVVIVLVFGLYGPAYDATSFVYERF